ncbi:MAG: hypothetical protein SGARI_004000 [Bacillariaceae sp.]
MSESYEDYEREYNASFFLAGTRSRVTLQECDRLLTQAKQHATAMQGLAEVEGNQLKIREAQQRLERDVAPLAKEVSRALQETAGSGGDANGAREELFYQAPGRTAAQNNIRDMESLIGNSNDLLQESLSLTMETEQIGNDTIGQMTRQREQIQGANSNARHVREIAEQASVVLTDMGRKAFRSKLVLYVMIGVLIKANLWAFVRMLKKK